MCGKLPLSIASGESSCRCHLKKCFSIFDRTGYRFLAVEPEHAAAVGDLAAYHQDPFDRLLVAQALVEPMRLMTHDATVARYSDTIILI